MKIALAQLNYHIGNFELNTQKIITSIEAAKAQQADLIVFAELAIGGYPAKDLLRNAQFLNSCHEHVNAIAAHCFGIACLIGAPYPNKDQEGKQLFNAALLIEQGKVSSVTKKSFLPDYDVFDEYRYFEPNRHFSCIDINGTKIALTICEDLWDDDEANSYYGDLKTALAAEKPSLLINLAASPFSYTQFEARLKVLQQSVATIGCPLLYVNQVGAHTDIIFDGRSMVLNAQGQLLHCLKSFQEDFLLLDSDSLNTALPIAIEPPTEALEIASIHQALICGIQDYFHKSGFKKAILGLSGGLDSALVAALACEALGPQQVMAVLMPSIYSSDHSLKDALDLVKNTGCHHHIIPIKDVAESFDTALAPIFKDLSPDTTEENIQARTRGTLLMAVSNKMGYILLNTSNKSEAAVGYGTLYGDMAGSLSVIGDLYKTQAFALARYINREREIIPVHTIVKPPSAELRPDQKDSDSLPPYELLDSILFHLIEGEKTNTEIVALGFDKALVSRVNTMVNNAEFKRFQAPPILRISPKAFGPGRSMPLVAKYPI